MPNPRKRTWTLRDLDRSQPYILFFDRFEDRWEVVDDDVQVPGWISLRMLGIEPVYAVGDLPEDPWFQGLSKTPPGHLWAVPDHG